MLNDMGKDEANGGGARGGERVNAGEGQSVEKRE